MRATVRYHCPRCGTVVSMERAGYLADESVTGYPLEGWRYVAAEAFADGGDDTGSTDGVRFVCGESAGVAWDGEGCGEAFYLSFVRFEDGREVEPEPPRETVRLAGPGPCRPAGPEGPGR